MKKFVEVAATKLSKAMRKKIYGVGINDAWYMVNSKVDGVQMVCPYYNKWVKCLERCYSEPYLNSHPTYRGCSIDLRWHRFSDFKRWMKTKNWAGMELDKDLKVIGNKVYGPDKCLFIPKPINSLISAEGKERDGMPKGVYPRMTIGAERYQVIHGYKCIGTFSCKQDASKAYINSKISSVKEIAAGFDDKEISEALYAWADYFKNKYLSIN